jgi:hypothetical protein
VNELGLQKVGSFKSNLNLTTNTDKQPRQDLNPTTRLQRDLNPTTNETT